MEKALVLRYNVEMEIRTQAHVAYKLKYHIVWIPKFRQKILVKGVARYCEQVIRSSVIDRYPDVEIYEMNIQKDHIHMIASIPPKYAISSVMMGIKSDSARELRKKFEYIRRNKSVWSVGYFVSSVGVDEKRITNYVKYQEKQDKGQTKFVI